MKANHHIFKKSIFSKKQKFSHRKKNNFVLKKPMNKSYKVKSNDTFCDENTCGHKRSVSRLLQRPTNFLRSCVMSISCTGPAPAASASSSAVAAISLESNAMLRQETPSKLRGGKAQDKDKEEARQRPAARG
jgi:hypothetical protein